MLQFDFTYIRNDSLNKIKHNSKINVSKILKEYRLYFCTTKLNITISLDSLLNDNKSSTSKIIIYIFLISQNKL